MRPLLLYGAGGHGKVVFDAARAAKVSFDVVADDDDGVIEFQGVEVMHPGHGQWSMPTTFAFIVAIGDNRRRANVFAELVHRGGTPHSVVHPRSTVSQDAAIGLGTLLCAGAIVNPGARLGVNCIVNTCASVDHDCEIGDHVHLCPGVRLGGQVVVGEGAMIGLGSVVLPGVSIGPWALVGAGSVVNRDVPPRVVAYGSPARVRHTI